MRLNPNQNFHLTIIDIFVKNEINEKNERHEVLRTQKTLCYAAIIPTVQEEPMRLSPYLQPELITTDVDASSCTTVIESMVQLFSKVFTGLDTDEALRVLLEREEQVPTGLENGIAIPHATIDSITDTTMGVALLPDAVDFGARDGSPVRLVFMILSPQDSISTHIKLLARIARLCSNLAFVQSLVDAKDEQDLRRLIFEEDQRHV